MTIKIKIRSRTSPIPYEIECNLDDFKPQDIAKLINSLEDTLAQIMKEIQRI